MMTKTTLSDIVCKNCGLINDFYVVNKSVHHMAYCNGCDSYIKNISYAVPTFYFGKYRGKKVEEVNDRHYLEWFLENVQKISDNMREAIKEKLKTWEEK